VLVNELWRFPVKSLGGERVEAVDVSELGLDGDRRWGLLDRSTGLILMARRDGRLLSASARLDTAGGVVITLPDGTESDRGEDIRTWLDRDVELVRAGLDGGHFENPRNFEDETDWVTWQGPPGAFHDMKRARVSLVTTATLGEWDVRRFRANFLLNGSGEDDLVGHDVAVGTCRLQVAKKIDRCIVVTRAQPGLDRDLDILRTINRERATFLAIGALVVRPGRISVGDRLVAVP
jgi:uncharacterized protein YcbX